MYERAECYPYVGFFILEVAKRMGHPVFAINIFFFAQSTNVYAPNATVFVQNTTAFAHKGLILSKKTKNFKMVPNRSKGPKWS